MTKPADMTTYRRADGEPIGGDYKFVTEMEWLDDEVEYDPLLVVEERWERMSTRTLMVCPPGMLCSACEGEGEVCPPDEPQNPQDCPRCKGTGQDPNAGQTVEYGGGGCLRLNEGE